jgi:hypothetical protein
MLEEIAGIGCDVGWQIRFTEAAKNVFVKF